MSPAIEEIPRIAYGSTLVILTVEALPSRPMARTAVHVRELTTREREILLLTADGRSAPDIALHLDLSPSAVKLVLLSSFEKLGVNDRAAAVAVALDSGLLD